MGEGILVCTILKLNRESHTVFGSSKSVINYTNNTFTVLLNNNKHKWMPKMFAHKKLGRSSHRQLKTLTNLTEHC